MEKTFSRPMVRLWGLKQQSPLLIFSWLRLRQQLSISTVHGRCYGRDISMTCFPYGTLIERKLTTSLNMQMTITRQNSLLTFLIKKSSFLIHASTKEQDLKRNLRLDTRTYFKLTETFQYTHFKSCHPPGVKKGFVKGEGLRLLRTNSSEETFVENIRIFKLRLRARGYPNNLIDKTLSEVKFSDRKKALKDNTRVQKEILPFVTQYNPSVPNLKHILMEKWHLIESQPKLKEMFKEPPIISYKRGISLRDILFRAKL